MKGWLDNYNDSKVSAPEGFQGEGYSMKGRNYSPAWGGQFQDGGFIPIAQNGRATAADSLDIYNRSLKIDAYYNNLKKKGWYPKKEIYPTRGLTSKDLEFEMKAIDKESRETYKKQSKEPKKYSRLKNMYPNADPKKANLNALAEHIKLTRGTKYASKDNLPSIIDPMAPTTVIDTRIIPKERVHYETIEGVKSDQFFNKYPNATDKQLEKHSEEMSKLRHLMPPSGTAVNLYRYDPLSVKPWNMLTDAEKKLRVQKYGTDGVPKSYIKGIKDKLDKDPKPDKKPNPDKKLDADPKIRLQPDLPMVEAVNLPPMQQLQSINPPVISDVVREPKSYNVSRKTYNTKGGLIDYYTKDEEGVDYERAMLIKSGADAWNRDILKRYGPQNEYRTPKSAEKAAERLKQLRSEFEMTPNYQMGGSVYPVNYVPQAQDGTELSEYDIAMRGMMKSKIGMGNAFGNPAIKRMSQAMPKTGMTPEGIGTHYMGSMDNYAVPLLQDFGGDELRLVNPNTRSREAIRFNSPEEAQYFAEHYKDVAPMSTIYKGLQEYAMGGSIPGAVGFTYARTINPAPDNGPGAKKTMASAQNGVKTKKDKLKKLETLLKNPPVFKKKNFEDDLKERPREMVRDNTRVVFRDENGRQKTVNPNRQVSTKYNAVEEAKRKKQETKAMLADRKARIEDSILAQDEDIIGNPNWREVMARETQATGDKFRLFPEEDSFFDDYLNPAVMIGNMATDLGQAPYYAKEQDSYMPYVTSIGIPLLTGALEGIGAKTNRQFINNIANPFNVVPGYSAAKKYVGNKLGNISTNIAPKLEQPILSNASSFGNKTKSFLRNNVFTDKTFNRLETIDNGLNKSYRAVNPFHHIQAQKSLDEANSWMDNWYNDPITKEKIKEASSRFGPNSFNEEQLLKNIENKTYRSSFEANTNKVDNFLAGNPRVHKGNYGVSGYYLDAYKDQSKRQNLVDKYINPDMIRSTAIHEGNHGLTNGNQFIRGYEDVLQSPFDTANFKPRLDDGSFEKYSDYLLDPTEINARLSEIRYEHGLKPGENLTPERVNSIIDKGVSGKSKVDAAFFNLINDRNKFKDMMNYVPAAVPIAGGIGIASQMQNEEEVPGMKDGGVIKDDMGQWNHPGEITEIGSNQITMEGVPYPVLGISDTGDMQMMYPEEDYEFDGESVTEYPMAKNGIRQEQKGLVNLDQLTNFTNYNKPQPGGWLNKYN